MKPIYIIGASDSSREFRELIPDKYFAGFIDDFIKGEDIDGNVDWLDAEDYFDCEFVVAIGNPQIKKEIVEKLNKKHATFATLIHPGAIVIKARLGEGCIIMPGSIISRRAIIQNHAIIHYNTVIGHDSTIGNYCNINPGVNISGNVAIEEGCYIGTNSAILQKIKIGKNSQVSAGSVVFRDVPERVIVGGNPARIIKKI